MIALGLKLLYNWLSVAPVFSSFYHRDCENCGLQICDQCHILTNNLKSHKQNIGSRNSTNIKGDEILNGINISPHKDDSAKLNYTLYMAHIGIW